MGQADSYIRRVRNECKLSHLEDIFDLYDFVPNNDLRILSSISHQFLFFLEKFHHSPQSASKYQPHKRDSGIFSHH